MAVQDRDDPASYYVLMRAKNDVDARRVTTMGNRGSKNQLPRSPEIRKAFEDSCRRSGANAAGDAK
jgi:hypothetical protein